MQGEAAALELLGELAEHGVAVRRRRGRLVVDAPPTAPADLLGRVAAAEESLLAAVAAHPGGVGPRPSADAASSGAFALTDLQSAYQVGEVGYPELSTPAYVAHGFEVPDLDPERLRSALRAVLERHEMLRVRVEEPGRQRVCALDPSWGPRLVDWGHLGGEEAREAFRRERGRAAGLLPDLAQGPQLGCAVHRARDSWFVLLSLRLFVLDARSIGLVCRDLAAACEQRLPAGGRTGAFARYAAALAEHRGSQAHRNAVAHWQRRLPDLAPPPELPTTGRPATAEFARVRHRLAAPRWARLQQRARTAGLSANAVLCASYAEVLRRWSAGQQRFSLTVLVATRGLLAPGEDATDWGECVGNFGTTLLLECDGRAASFRERTAALQQRLMDDLPHCWVSGVEVARRARRTGPAEAVGSPFVFASGLDASPGEELPPHLRLPGWELVFKSMHTPQVLLDHQVSEEDGELVCTFDHVAAAFPEGLVEELAEAHADLLRRLADDDAAWSSPEPPPLPDPLLAARRAANRTERRFPPGSVLDGLLRGGDRPALLGADAELTYGQAGWEVARLAGTLAEQGPVAPGELVGVLARKSVGQYLAALAVTAAGGAYVPLGVDWPPARIAALLARNGIGRVLADAEGARLLAGLGRAGDAVEIGSPGAAGSGPAVALRTPAPTDLAYVIFTSGSTGEPKGVAIPHSGLLNTVQDMVERYGLGPDDRLLSLSELHFDLSAFDLFGALHCGGAVVVPPCGPVPDPELWEQWLRRSGATVWNTVPALLEMLLDHLGEERSAAALGGLRLVLLSGDWIPLGLPERVRRACPKAEIVALGGATEASIWSNHHTVERIDPAWKSVPYGRPLVNQRYHVLGGAFEDRPHWVPGELFIAGAGLAAGYHGRPDLTEARFPRHPRTGERLYRTGDHARYWPDGTLEFLGRQDSQAKVRGYRVDLLEVEQQLTAEPGVRAAACVVRGTGSAARLIAFTVPDGDAPPDPARLRAALAAALPKYALPSAFHSLPALPLTPNGKRDTRALLALAETPVEGAAGPAGGAAGRPPRGRREEALARLWERVCGAPVRSAEEDFFAVGGSSVSAVRLLRLIEQELGVRLPLSSLFEASTVAAQAALLESHRERLLVPVRAGGTPPLVLVHPVGGHLLGYRELVAALPPQPAVYGLQSPPAERLPATLGELAGLYTAAVRSLGDGPVHLLGWSMGGVLAGEIAHRLADTGTAPLSLTVLDSFAGGGPSAEPEEAVAAAAFFADHLGQSDPAEGRVVAPPPDCPDPFGRLAAEHLPGEPVEQLRELYAQYRALYRLLLAHSPRPLPELPAVLAVRAKEQRADGFPGLVPLDRHPAGLLPAAAALHTLPGTHYSVVRAGAARAVAELLHDTLAPKGSA